MSHVPLAEGFARIHLTPSAEVASDDAQMPLTPGSLAQLSGLDPENIGMIKIDDEGQGGLIDVINEFAKVVCARLNEIGKAIVVERNVPPVEWEWLYIGVGRSQGIGMTYLRNILQRAEAGLLGAIHIQGTFTIVGLHKKLLPLVADKLNEKPINGVRPLCRVATRQETGGKPADYSSKKS